MHCKYSASHSLVIIIYTQIVIVEKDGGGGLKMEYHNSVGFCRVKTRKTAIRRMPWASWIIKVCGGYCGYEYYNDYLLCVGHKPQKRHVV